MSNEIKSWDWVNLDIKNWNTTTFRAYLKSRHEELFGITYVPKNYGMEAKMLKNTINEYGTIVTKKFIDLCMENYKPTSKYPGINYTFMYSYLRDRYIPQILQEKEKEEKRKKRQEEINYDEIVKKL